MKEKIVLGLSGGVDSAVAARLLLQERYEVTGLYLDIGLGGYGGGGRRRRGGRAWASPFETADIRAELERAGVRPLCRRLPGGPHPPALRPLQSGGEVPRALCPGRPHRGPAMCPPGTTPVWKTGC